MLAIYSQQLGYCENPTLDGYIKHDLSLKTLVIEVKKSELSRKDTRLDNGFYIKIATGAITFFNTGERYDAKFEPSVNASLPVASNLSVGVSSKVTTQSDVDNITDTKLSFSIDVISGAMLTRKAALIQADRAYLVAKRNLRNGTISCEKEYYTALKALYSQYSAIIALKKELYDDKIDFDDTRAKGFSASSSKYRLAQMKVATDEHNIDVKTRLLRSDCAVFASKCGITFEDTDNIEDFLPSNIDAVPLFNIADFKKEDYAKIENANFSHEYEALKRRADKNFSFKINGGYTFNNSTSNSDTVDTGLTAGVSGIDISAGVSFPIDSPKPIYTTSATIIPTQFIKRKITTDTGKCNNQEELIDIDKALLDYDSDVIKMNQQRSDIEWSIKTDGESYNLYKTLALDMEDNYRRGIITQSESLASTTNREDYRTKLIMDAIDSIIYNDDVTLLFF